jgi:hypothetical protein
VTLVPSKGGGAARRRELPLEVPFSNGFHDGQPGRGRTARTGASAHEGANHRDAGRVFSQQATNLLTLAGSVSLYASKYPKRIKSYNQL